MCLPSAVILNLTDEDVDERGFYRRLNRIKITRAQRRQFDMSSIAVSQHCYPHIMILDEA